MATKRGAIILFRDTEKALYVDESPDEVVKTFGTAPWATFRETSSDEVVVAAAAVRIVRHGYEPEADDPPPVHFL